MKITKAFISYGGPQPVPKQTYVEDHPREGLSFCKLCRVSFVTSSRREHEKQNRERHLPV